MGESTKNQRQQGKNRKAKKPDTKTKAKTVKKWWRKRKSSEINHKAFVLEYLKNGRIAYKAYQKFYPWTSEKSARNSASRLMTNDYILSLVDSLTEKTFKEEEIDVKYIIGGLKEVAEKCLQRRKVKTVEIVITKKWDEETKEEIEKLVIGNFNPKEANNAFDKLGKYKKLRTDTDKDKDKEPTVNNIHIHLPDNNRWQIEP